MVPNSEQSGFSQRTLPGAVRAQRRLDRVVKSLARPIQEFLKLQSASGILLFACALVALLWSNSGSSHSYDRFWHTSISLGFGNTVVSKSLLHWINDGLMVLFFLLVGLEIKRELLLGELSTVRKALLPVIAGLGGMILPAIIYLAFNSGTDRSVGWGIPMATDIAFSLGVLTLLGRRIPLTLKVFLTAFAIVDDIGAVVVIALFYASQIAWNYLLLAGGILLLLVGANWIGVRHSLLYGVLGALLWLAFLSSGVHATVAGVLLAMAIPARSKIDKERFVERSRSLLTGLEQGGPVSAAHDGDREYHERVRALSQTCEDFEPPTQRFEHALHPWVTFVIMPLFALANAGVTFSPDVGSLTTNPLALGIVSGLVVGKPVGIVLFSWIAARTGFASLPETIGWRHLWGVGCLGGIGFTMSLFIAGLAFGASPLMDVSKIGIYAASVVAALAGALVLVWQKRGG